MAPTITDWLRLINSLRPLQTQKKRLLQTGDSFSAAAYAFHSTQAGQLRRFGIHQLFLRTKDARSSKYYDISSAGGHIAHLGHIPPVGNYTRITSRSYELTSDAISPKTGLRLQVVAYCA